MRRYAFKHIAILLVCILSLSACGQAKSSRTQASDSDSVNALSIVTSFYPIYIFTRNIVRDTPGVSVVNMTEPQTGCLHDYQLSPSDMKTLEKAQIFVINGAGMESFLEKVIKQMPKLKIIEASKGLELIKENEDEVNPHVWVGISGAIREVRNIGEQLAGYDPANAANYRANTEEYVKKLERQKEKMHNELKGIKSRDIVTFHEAFPYFAKEFDLNTIAVIEREPGSEPGAGELSDTIKKVREANVKALFAEPQYPAKAAETIARETGAKVYVLDPVVTGPKVADPDAYIKAMDQNLKTLIEALK